MAKEALAIMTAPAARLPPPVDAADLVLVVDDEPLVREVVTGYLERDGYRVRAVADGEVALAALDTERPALLVLDLMLPGIDGLQILRRARAAGDLPIIVLSARTEEADRVLGLELGADDYVPKPFSPRELAARVRSVLRRASASSAAGVLTFPGLTIDRGSRQVQVDGAGVELTPREFDLLAFLAASPRQVFSRAQLLEQVWDSSADYQDPATVTVHVRRLRGKVETDPDRPHRIATVWGVGYRFDP